MSCRQGLAIDTEATDSKRELNTEIIFKQSAVATTPTTTATAAATAAAASATGSVDCCSSSEGYATSLDSSTASSASSNSSDTMSLASDCPSTSGVDNRRDSLSLALEELRIVDNRPTLAGNFFEAHQLIEQDEEADLQPVNKRSSSLKSKKTPPDTPNQMKKAVRFADAFGLDLTYVKHVFDLENPPEIPPQATSDLNLVGSDDENSDDANRVQQLKQHLQQQQQLLQLQQQQQGQKTKIYISPCFPQPGNSANFMSRVMSQKVVLENAHVTNLSSIDGVVRVSNVSFEKVVIVRATFDNWVSSSDNECSYVQNSSTGLTDQFAFSVPIAGRMRAGDKLAFCVCFQSAADTFWDNNFGDNYVFDCYAIQ